MIISRYLKPSSSLLRLSFGYHNFYDTLGVDHDAPQKEIKRKYYELAKKYHPDGHKHVNDPTQFIKIKQAYETLGDENKRKNQDNKFYSSQHYQYDNNNYYSDQRYGGAAYHSAGEHQKMYTESFYSVLKRSYFQLLVYLVYGYLSYEICSHFLDQLNRHDIELKQNLIDNTPGVVSRRKEIYYKEMREKNIYMLPVEVKGRTLVKESTKSMQKRKEGIVSIEGISKQLPEKDETGPKTEYM